MLNNMTLSNKGKIEICSYEGIILRPYLDTSDVWTIGLGHTNNDPGLKPSKMDPSKFISAQQAVDMFNLDIKRYEARVNKYITSPLTQNQYDALVSFDYNTGGIAGSTLTKRVNDGAPAADIVMAFMMWTKNKELVTRRTREKDLFIYGQYTSNGIILLQQTNGKGRLVSGGKNFNIGEYFIN